MTQIETASEQRTDRDLAEAKVPSGYTLGSGVHPYSAPAITKKASDLLKKLSIAPRQTIRVARFPKDNMIPEIVERQIVDVTPVRDRGGSTVNRIPDVCKDWEGKETKETERKTDWFFIAPQDVPEFPQLHGWYVIFSLYESRYDANTHAFFQGIGRHIHEDIFIAKIGPETEANGRTFYADMPEEFLSVRVKGIWKVYEFPSGEHRKSMLLSLIA